MKTIKELRKWTGLSLHKFAATYHLSEKTLERWEYGRTDTPEHILYMLNRLVEIDYGNGSKSKTSTE